MHSFQPSFKTFPIGMQKERMAGGSPLPLRRIAPDCLPRRIVEKPASNPAVVESATAPAS